MKRVFISLAAVLSLASMAPAHADQFRSLTMEFGADRLGGDYKVVQMADSDPLACQVLCAQDSVCMAYTFVPAALLTFDPRGPVPRCYLKSNAPGTSVYPGLISGKKLP